MADALKTTAIVLRVRRFSESSLIVTLLSREYGRLDALAKGARREKGLLFGHLDLYQKEDVLVLRRPQASLDLLTEAAFANEHVGLRFFPPAFAAAGLLADLAADATLPGEAVPEVFAVLENALAMLSDLGEPGVRAGLAVSGGFSSVEKAVLVGRVVKLALLDMLGWLGFGLELRRCVLCGSVDTARAAVSRRHGGLVCAACRTHARDAVAVTPAALASLRERDAGSERWETSLPAGERRRWLRFLVEYAQYALEKPLRGRKVLFQLLEVG